MGKASDKLSTIYAIRCATTGKIYVGVTYDINLRLKTHFAELRKGEKTVVVYDETTRKHSRVKSQWQRDYDEFGRDDFTAYLLEENIPLYKRSDRESYWIDRYRADDPEFGYNTQPAKRPEQDLFIRELPPMPEGGE